LVLNGHGTIQVSLNGAPIQDHPRLGLRTSLYVAGAESDSQGLLNLKFTPGVQAYDFTFG